MITTRGKDNISDVGRQKCVIIILVYAYFQFDWKRRMSYLPMFCATSSLNALCKQMRTEETSCLFLQLTDDLSRGYPAFFYRNFLRNFFVLC